MATESTNDIKTTNPGSGAMTSQDLGLVQPQSITEARSSVDNRTNNTKVDNRQELRHRAHLAAAVANEKAKEASINVLQYNPWMRTGA